MRAVPQSAAPVIIERMGEAMSLGVDIQLRILQTLVALIPNFPGINGELVGDVGDVLWLVQMSCIDVLFCTGSTTMLQVARI
jgi:hypothetical protein